MNEFTVLSKDDAVFCKRWFWIRKHSAGTDLFSRLIAIDITDDGIMPLYLPTITYTSKEKQLTFWINLSRWQSLVIIFGPRGIQTRYIDIRKSFEDE